MPSAARFFNAHAASRSPVAGSTMKSTARPDGWSEVPARPATPYIVGSPKRQPRNCAEARTCGLTAPRPEVEMPQSLLGCGARTRGFGGFAAGGGGCGGGCWARARRLFLGQAHAFDEVGGVGDPGFG